MEQFAILSDHVRHPLQVILTQADLMDGEKTVTSIQAKYGESTRSSPNCMHT